MKFIFILCLSFLNFFSANFTSKAAEKINIKFEEMSIPISIDELSRLDKLNQDSTEIIDWFRNNGLEKIFELSKYLKFPIFKQDGFSKQILRSWIGKKVLSEFSNTFLVPNDINGIQVFNTIEKLLEQKKEVSTIDILKTIPVEEIQLDVDNLIKIISSWKKSLEEQQNYTKKLKFLDKSEENISLIFNNISDLDSKSYQISLNVPHREEPLTLKIWMPETNLTKDLIIFMPGLGGDVDNFEWLGSGLSKKGWPVIFIEHKGSDSIALNSSINGNEALPGGADIYLYRIKDLDFVIKSYNQGQLGFKSTNSYILMGHSLGALISMLYEGNPPNSEFISRCENALGDFALTNLSKLLQCQLSEIPIPEFEKSKDLKGIVGFNSFGSLIWSDKENSGIDVPILFIGGTFDLITPLISEQSKLFLANEPNKLSRFLIIEGASHFSPIRVLNKNLSQMNGNDVFKIKEDFIGINPYKFQNLTLKIIIQFLSDFEKKEGLKLVQKQNIDNLNFHIFGEKELKKLLNN